MAGSLQLPQTEPQKVREFQSEYIKCSKAGSQETPNAGFRFVWALVHSPDPAHVQRGLDLAQQMLNAQELDQQGQDDLVYFCAVAQFRRGSYQAAKTQINEYLKVKPGSRQGVDLKKAIDDAIVREGLIGVGVGTGILAAGAVAIGLLLSGRKH